MFEKEKTFTELSLTDIARSYPDKGDAKTNSSTDIIRVPGFQRNAVWREAKVEDLWDSLLCRFPIGSILLARFNDFSSVGTRPAQLYQATEQPDTVIDSEGNGFIVVDGQQRLNAISVGLVPYEKGNAFRLWVDLGIPTDRTGRARFPKRLFYFFLCTQDNPFGAGLTKQEKRDALHSIGKDGVDDSELSLAETYPYWAKAPVPFYEFCRLIEAEVEWKSIRAKLANYAELNIAEKLIGLLQKKYESVLDISHLLNAIKDVVQNKPGYQIPAILVKKSGNFMTSEMLGRLFERVNIGGETPPRAEIFYSALKLRAPIISNYVAEIYNDKEIGRLFRPTDIVLNALRMVNPSILELQLENFEKIARENEAKLLALMESKDSDHSDFHDAIYYTYKALHHNGQQGDIGLPRQLLGRLRGRIWQTITYWVKENLTAIRQKEQIDPQDRLRLIQYAVLDSLNYFLVWQKQGGRKGDIRQYKRDEITRKAINSLEGEANFDLHSILSDIKPNDQDIKFHLLTPEEFKVKIRHPDDPDNLQSFVFSNEDALLLFAQRYYIATWEKLDLEVDHIAPSAWMFFKAGQTQRRHFWRVSKIEHWQRYSLQHSIGNKRYWPEAWNAGDQDKPLELKLEETPKTLAKGYDTTKILDASFIQSDLVDEWKALSTALQTEKDQRIWTNERFFKFKQIVDERRYRMYKHLYDTLRLHELVDILS